MRTYPRIQYSCLVDNIDTAQLLSEIFSGQKLTVFIDLNVGMNRTGIPPEKAPALYEACSPFKNILIAGLHAYDGHIHDTDLKLRKQRADEVYQKVLKSKSEIEKLSGSNLKLILGGTATFYRYAGYPDVESSPGTFIYWDEGYHNLMPDLAFHFAAVLMTRIISIIDKNTVCLDLGYKSVAAENPLPRVKFLNAEHAVPVGQSEEHMVVRVPDSASFNIGDVWYAVPVHICPTVALYEEAFVIHDAEKAGQWRVTARNRVLTF